MEKYTEKELEAIKKAKKILEKAGMHIEGSVGGMPEPDGIERWCIHPAEEE